MHAASGSTGTRVEGPRRARTGRLQAKRGREVRFDVLRRVCIHARVDLVALRVVGAAALVDELGALLAEACDEREEARPAVAIGKGLPCLELERARGVYEGGVGHLVQVDGVLVARVGHLCHAIPERVLQ